MKKLILIPITIGMIATTAFAFDVNLYENGRMAVDKLIEVGATSVSCENFKPRCVLAANSYGIQYPGQELKDVSLARASSNVSAKRQLKELREDGFCE